MKGYNVLKRWDGNCHEEVTIAEFCKLFLAHNTLAPTEKYCNTFKTWIQNLEHLIIFSKNLLTFCLTQNSGM